MFITHLGVTLDQELTFVQHINLLCRSCYYQLRQLRVISRSLSPDAASTLVHSFVVSRLDYCSAIYDGLPACRLKCLNRVLRSEEHTSELQSQSNLVCRLLLEKKKRRRPKRQPPWEPWPLTVPTAYHSIFFY